MNPIHRENVVPFHDHINKCFLGLLTIGLLILPKTGIPHNTSDCPDSCYHLHSCLWHQNIRNSLCSLITVWLAQEHNAFLCHPYDYWQKISSFLYKVVKCFVLGNYAFIYWFIYLSVLPLSQFVPGKITEDERITVLLGCVKM